MMVEYLISQFIKRIGLFFWRWYVGGSKKFWARVLDIASELDRFYAIKINARIWLQPLYGDYTPVGQILGPFFRTFRILLGFVSYAFLFSIAFVVWLLWLAIPTLVVVRIIVG